MADYIQTQSNEPPYTKGYSNETICNYFYYLSIIILFVAFMSLGIHAWALMTMAAKYRGPIILNLLLTITQMGIAYFIYLFSYLVCSRSLLDKKV